MLGPRQKVVIITGASSGIGKATALRLLKEGHIVYGGARRVDKMSEIQAAGGHAYSLDVTEIKEINQFVTRVVRQQGRIDVLINNAGYGAYGAMEDFTAKAAKQQFDVNLFGLAEMTKAVLPYMRKAEAGTIINVSSMGGKMYTPLGAWYHATKHALEGWSDCLRLELKEFGIHVVIVEPGAINTDFAEVMLKPLLERSGTGPYKNFANAVAGAMRQTYSNPKSSSDPEVIAEVMAKAISSKKPKTRYVAGKYAWPMMFIRKYLGDRIFDALVLRMMRTR